jgi:hypothetical protein
VVFSLLKLLEAKKTFIATVKKVYQVLLPRCWADQEKKRNDGDEVTRRPLQRLLGQGVQNFLLFFKSEQRENRTKKIVI